MKNIIVSLMLIIPLMGLAQEKTKKHTKSTFEVNGNCKMCKMRIEKSALSIKGVKMASWDIPSQMLSLIHDPKKASVENVQKIIAGVGHDTAFQKANDSIYSSLPMCCLYRTVEKH
jgi:cation transport ATPase